MKIGIYGSSFDPITNVHLWTASTVANREGLDKVIFLPCNNKLRPDNKFMKTTDEHRKNMVKMAIENNPLFLFDDFEMNLSHGRVTTFETMNMYKTIYPNDELYFIMGADLLVDLPEWDHGAELIKSYKFIVMARDGIDMLEVIAKNPILRNNSKNFSLMHKGLAMEISSTFIRDELAMGGEPRYLLPDVCYNYIKEHKLYTNPITNKHGIRH